MGAVGNGWGRGGVLLDWWCLGGGRWGKRERVRMDGCMRMLPMGSGGMIGVLRNRETRNEEF